MFHSTHKSTLAWGGKKWEKEVCMMKEFVQREQWSRDTEKNRFEIVKGQRGIVLCTTGMENIWLIHSTSMSASASTIHLTSSVQWRGNAAANKRKKEALSSCRSLYRLNFYIVYTGGSQMFSSL